MELRFPIEDIKVGDIVVAWDENTGDVSAKKVLETYVNETEKLIHLTVNGEHIVTTPTHPFYSPVKGWTDAVNLRAGDMLVLVNGEYVVLEKVQHEILESPITVYNFQVEGYHTYYVGECGVLVHNSCRAKNKIGPDSNANGSAHTVIQYDNDGNITHYATYEPNPRNPHGYDEVVKYDAVGKAHNGVPTPHYHVKGEVLNEKEYNNRYNKFLN